MYCQIKYIIQLFLFIGAVVLVAKPISIAPLFQYSLQPIQNRISAKNLTQCTIEFWTTYFQSHANTADNNYAKENVASLIFGSRTFKIEDFISRISEKNPLFALQYMPCCSIKRNGVLFELRMRKKYSEKTYFFIKAKMNYCLNKVIVKSYGNEFDPETATIDDLFQITNDGFAFRFDALLLLPLTSTGIGREITFVNFFDTTFKEPGISMRGLLVTDSPLAETPVIVEKTTPNTPPQQAMFTQQGAQLLLPFQPTEPLSEGTMRRFGSLIDYTSVQERSDLNSLWILPTTTGDQLATNAQKIKDAVQNLLTNEQFHTTSAIMASVGIDLKTKNNKGFGGILIEPGVEIHVSSHFIQSVYGIIILPAERTISGGEIFKIPTGNNGHGAVGLGTTIIAPLTDPIIVSLDFGCFYTIPKQEQATLPLKKSKITIGPVIEQTVSWNTVYLNPSYSVTYQKNNVEVLCAVDYFFYYASRDHISTSHLFFPEKAAFAIQRKEERSKQLVQTINITLSYKHYTASCIFNALFMIAHTVHAHNALYEKGWSITCGITF